MKNSINAINLIVSYLFDYDDSIKNYKVFGGKELYDFIATFEHYARQAIYTYNIVDGEEKKAAIELFNEINEKAKNLKFVETWFIRKGTRVTVYDRYGAVASVKDGHYGDNWLIDLAMKYGRQWKSHIWENR